MPKPYSNNPKTKKLRRRAKRPPSKPTTTPKGKTEELYNYLISKGHHLDEGLKDEKFYNVLKRFRNSKIGAGTLSRLVQVSPDKLLCGPIGKVLGVEESLRTIFQLRHISLPDFFNSNFEIMAMRHNSGKIVLFDSAGHKWEHLPRQWIYAELVATRVMPADLRKWPSSWVINYFRARVLNVGRKGRCNIGTSSSAIDGGVNKLHQIRKINSFPTRKQQKKISKNTSKQVFDANDIDMLSTLTSNSY